MRWEEGETEGRRNRVKRKLLGAIPSDRSPVTDLVRWNQGTIPRIRGQYVHVLRMCTAVIQKQLVVLFCATLLTMKPA